MVEMILKYSTGDEVVNVPTEWSDITFKQYVELLKLENEPDQLFEDRIKNRFKAFLGVSPENFALLKITTVEAITSLLLFSFDFVKLNEFYKVPKEYEGFDVGEQEWQKLIECQIYMKNVYAKYPLNDEMTNEEKEDISAKILLEMYMIGDVFVKAFIGKDIKEEKLTEVYWMPGFFLTRYFNFFQSSPMMKAMAASSQTYIND